MGLPKSSRCLTARMVLVFAALLLSVAEGFAPSRVSWTPPPIIHQQSKTEQKKHFPHMVVHRQRHVVRKAFPNNNNNNNNNNSSPKPGGGLDMDPGLKLLLCILIDFLGVASFAAPGLGEATDVAWAPISAVLVNYLFGNGVFTALAFVEELLPGFDIVPTATIAWFVENGNRVDTNPTVPPPSSPSSRAPPPPQGRAYTANTPPPNGDSKKSSTRSKDVIDVEIID